MKKIGPIKTRLSYDEDKFVLKKFANKYLWPIIAGIALLYVLFVFLMYWLGGYSHKTFSGQYAFLLAFASGVFGMYLGGQKVDENFQDPINKLIFQKVGKRHIETETTITGEDCYRTKKGDWVKSIPEQTIADYLYDNHILYKYEDPVTAKDGSIFRPDFFLPKHKVWIEYFGGMNRFPEYNQHMHWKFEQFDALKMRVIKLYPDNAINLIEVLGYRFEKETGKKLGAQQMA